MTRKTKLPAKATDVASLNAIDIPKSWRFINNSFFGNI
jgi:hypothetical protein